MQIHLLLYFYYFRFNIIFPNIIFIYIATVTLNKKYLAELNNMVISNLILRFFLIFLILLIL